jgi:hypothetical protein
MAVPIALVWLVLALVVPVPRTVVSTPPITSVPTATVPASTPYAGLSSTQSAFTLVYGVAKIRDGVPVFSFTALDGTVITVALRDTTQGTDGQNRAEHLVIAAADGTTWDDKQGIAYAQHFVPDDTAHLQDVTSPRLGLVHVFRSSLLASRFPDATFRNRDGTRVDPGTFSIACQIPTAAGCDIALGIG